MLSDEPTKQKIRDKWVDQNDATRTGEAKYLAKNELFEAAVIHVQATGNMRVFNKMERMLLKHLEQSRHTHSLISATDRPSATGNILSSSSHTENRLEPT